MSTTLHPSLGLLDEAIAAITAATADHQPGEAYQLSRRAFGVMALGKDLGPDPDPEEDGYDAPLHYRASLWGAIAEFEARRSFTDGNRCGSDLTMDSHGLESMVWEYQTTSGTIYRAVEAREVDGDPPQFTVTIWEERDQPGRTAWSYVRLAMAGWVELAIYNVYREDATPVQLARIALTEALFAGDPAAAPQRLEALLAKA